ncbi:uncharacterized protein PV06_03944 [Exophiala oligosperma]|uniref:WSC domain-containing protein n=1 Tax=Exophiala oligosperma TaxID=215243 RepID=A0A0D2DRK0_9EURO|nr:uncharacterized protein PV06_03944 [Exophiala oligosperma]KIW45563.1 hypothetical protein PV06_03944 [Exophiala oligosperma]
MKLAILAIVALSLVATVVSRPAQWFAELADDIGSLSLAQHLCSRKHCLFGDATFDGYSLSCQCPDMPINLFADPCEGLECPSGTEPFYSVLDQDCYCGTMEAWFAKEESILQQLESEGRLVTQKDIFKSPNHEEAIRYDLRRRQEPSSAPTPTYTALPTFVPPPTQDITPELLNQSLSVQPQNTATISSIIPFFMDNVLCVYIQLNGTVADTLIVNASASLPCGDIGVDPEPNMALVPKVVQQGDGQPQVQVADCQCIAVNMYDPNVITYWIQKVSDGSIYSLTGSNKVVDIDKMNTTQTTALDLVTLSAANSKRNAANIEYLRPVRRQIFGIECGQPCPFYHMYVIKTTDGYCGCIFHGADEKVGISPRALVVPDINTATMTEAACRAMICYNNGNQPAVFNPFSMTCWCNTPPAIEYNADAWKPDP